MANNLIKIKGAWKGAGLAAKFGAMMPHVRPYRPDDFAACLALFDGNVPKFFAATERADFLRFLQGHGDLPYLVIEEGGAVVACGGIEVTAGTDGLMRGSLTWGMVDRARHGLGVGRVLTEARLAALRALPGVEVVGIETSQHTAGFYAGFGFKVLAVTPDGFGPGIDRWDMELALRG